MSERLRIVVSGYLAQYPLGGVAWDYLQYPLGLLRLGHDVHYFEDTGQWPYDPLSQTLTDDCTRNVEHLRRTMDRFGLGDRWAYHNPFESRWYGLSDARRRDVVATADLVLNVSGTLRRPAECGRRARLAFLDSDPVFTQVKLARGQHDFRRFVEAHDVLFSFGERLPGEAPDTGHPWWPTRQPIVLDEWRHALPHRSTYTTVMNWTSYNPVRHDGRTYGQKDAEFERFFELPARLPGVRLEIAVARGRGRRPPVEKLRRLGWLVTDPAEVCAGLDEYRDYVVRSKGEWSVAKHGYVVGRAGWFSCRSACYLAAGRPVVVQDTGFSEVIPTGRGVLAFADLDQAAAALEEVERDHERHAAWAKDVAREYFDAGRVLEDLLERAFATPPARTEEHA